MRDYFTSESLGPKRHLTPEGFLVCKDVPIGRTGIQQYSHDQVPEVPAGFGGIVDMERPAEEVFRPSTIASFEGKPVTNDHPFGGGVVPDNYRELAVGHIQNVRRGAHPEDDLLLADLFINDPKAIADINDGGKREVSCGYDHDVVVIDRGRGRQVNIIGNHLAIVDQGRCGPRCVIGDTGRVRVNDRKGMVMAKNFISDLIARAFMAKSKDELNEINKEAEDAAKNGEGAFMGGPDQHVHVHLPSGSEGTVTKDEDKDKDDDDEEKKTEDRSLRSIVQDGFSKITESFKNLDSRITKLEARDEKDPDDDETDDELPPQFKKKGDDDDDDDDKKKKDEFPGPNAGSNHSLGKLGFENPLFKSDAKGGRRTAKDSVQLEDAFDEMLARAEILVPGIRMPTFDARLDPRQTMERVCSFKRRVIGAALQNDDDRGLLEDVNGGRALDLKRMSCDRVSIVFDAAAAIKQRDTVSSQMGSGRHAAPANAIKGIADLQKRIDDYWTPRLNKRAL
jgi:hypothetical protein